jgi:hypothetical protein
LINPTNETVWTVGLLVYPNKETSCKPLFQALGEKNIKLYKGVFLENNATSIESFFGSEIIL